MMAHCLRHLSKAFNGARDSGESGVFQASIFTSFSTTALIGIS